MKFIIFIAFIYPTVLFTLNLRQSDDPVLSSTPKAKSLRDNFGVSAYRNNYGPPPSLNLDNLMIRNADGSWMKMANPDLKDQLVTPSGSKCDITQHAYYNICYAAGSCAECAAMESCGWCEHSKKCLPGNIDGCFCKDDCLETWAESYLQCTLPDKVVLGEMTNMSPLASHFVTPELTGPKLNVTTIDIHPGWDQKPMVIGNTITRKNVTTMNAAENHIVEGEINLGERIVRDIPIPTLEIHAETKTYDLLTRKEIVSNSTNQLHGIDTLKQ